MNYNNCNGWNEYAGTYEGAYYAGDAAFARTAAAGGNSEVLRPQPQQALPGHAAEQAGPAIYTGRAIWQGSMPTTDVISRLRQGQLPRQQTGPLRLQTAAAPAITAIIAVIGTIAATAATAALKNCRS